MPPVTHLPRCLFTVAGSLLAAGCLQAAQAGEPTIVPVEQEPQHRPVFRNATVAVLDVLFPPGYVSLFHRHSNDNVSVRLETGPARIDTLETTGTVQTAAVGRLVFNSATPPYTHRVVNVGDAAMRILDIEILATAPTPVASAVDDIVRHEVVVENSRVRLMRVVSAAGQSHLAHLHSRGRVEVIVRGPGAGQFKWRAPGEPSSAIAAGPDTIEVAEIEIK